jgi:hypothetical protein
MDFEESAQNTPQRLGRLPNHNIHCNTPFSMSAAGAAARDQQKGHQKQQRAYRENRRD